MWHRLHTKLDWCALALFMCDIKMVLHPPIWIFPMSHSRSVDWLECILHIVHCHLLQWNSTQHIQMLIRLNAIKSISISMAFKLLSYGNVVLSFFLRSNNKCATDQWKWLNCGIFGVFDFYWIWSISYWFSFFYLFTCVCCWLNRLQWTGSSITATSRPIE